MIIFYRAGQLKGFAPFSYLNHSFILSLNVKVCIRFIVFLQISLCFFICQELCWMRGLCISFTSSCFLFPVGGERKKFEDWGGGLKIFKNDGGRGYFCWGVNTPLHAMIYIYILYYIMLIIQITYCFGPFCSEKLDIIFSTLFLSSLNRKATLLVFNNLLRQLTIPCKQYELLANVTVSRSAVNMQNRILVWVNNSYHLFGKVLVFALVKNRHWCLG